MSCSSAGGATTSSAEEVGGTQLCTVPRTSHDDSSLRPLYRENLEFEGLVATTYVKPDGGVDWRSSEQLSNIESSFHRLAIKAEKEIAGLERR